MEGIAVDVSVDVGGNSVAVGGTSVAVGGTSVAVGVNAVVESSWDAGSSVAITRRVGVGVVGAAAGADPKVKFRLKLTIARVIIRIVIVTSQPKAFFG